MPLWAAAIVGGFLQAAGTFVGRVLVSLGIGYASFSGIDASITWARDYAITQIQGLPTIAIQVASTIKVGTAISILTSALVARMLFQGLTSGTVKRMFIK